MSSIKQSNQHRDTLKQEEYFSAPTPSSVAELSKRFWTVHCWSDTKKCHEASTCNDAELPLIASYP